MSDDDDWVARLLGSAERPTMPTDVADRLDRTLRSHIDGELTAGPATAPADPDGGVAGGPVAAVTAAETHREQDATSTHTPPVVDEVPGPTAGTPAPAAQTPAAPTAAAQTAASSTPATPTPAAATAGTPAPATAPGSRGTGHVPATAPGTVPPAAVPPPATSGTGVLPVLRAGTPAADDGAGDPDGSGADGTDRDGTSDGTAPGTADDAPATSTTRSGRTFGSSRREQRAEDVGERRRRLLVRWAPVAAGVLVLGGAGIAVSQLTSGQDSAVETADEAAAAGAAEAVAPRALVATGTEYQTADTEVFSQQVRDLVSVAASGESGDAALSAPAEESDTAGGGADGSAEDAAPTDAAAPEAAADDAGVDPSAAREAVAGSPLADATALQECVDRVTGAEGDVALAVDEAVVDGVESTVVVVEDPAGASLFVYVVGPDCDDSSQFDFYDVTP